jgi:hypothetical protein
MKKSVPVKPIQPDKPQPIPGVIHGDHLYYQCDKAGVNHGKVVAMGKHGITIERDEDGKIIHDRVHWHRVLGHKQRAQRKLVLVDRGEDGAIAEDENGKRVFIRGDLPEADEKMNKAFTADSGVIERLERIERLLEKLINPDVNWESE